MRWLGPGVVALLVALAGCSSSAATTARQVTSDSRTSTTAAPSTTAPAPAPTTPAAPAPVVVLDPGHNDGNAARPRS